MNNHTIEWIFFDVGGVLLDESEFLAWRQHNNLAIVNRYLPAVTMKEILQRWPQASAMIGNLDSNILQLFLSEADLDEAYGVLSASYATAPQYYNQPIRPKALSVIQHLSQNYKLGIIANQSIQAKQKLARAGLINFLHTSEMSEHIGADKPDSVIFTTVMNSVGADPTRSVMIDDNIERGLIPAKRLGMTTIWYQLEQRSVPEGVVDHAINTLADLLHIF